jgi:hypothetical protein
MYNSMRLRFNHLAAAAAVSGLMLTGCASQGAAPAIPLAHDLKSAPFIGIEPNSGPKTIPFYSSSFVYAGKTYKLKIVGTNPRSGGVSTTVANQIVPIKLVFSDGTVLNGGNESTILTASPVYVNATYDSGTTQFSDALMRAEFWQFAASENYHVLLAAPHVMPVVRVSVPAGDGVVVGGEGRVAYQWFLQTIEPQLLQQLNIDPTTLTIFLTKNTRLLEPSGHCCFSGFHSSYNLTIPSGPATFTTAWASVAAGSVARLSHEISEWMNDPFNTNVVPKWLFPNSSACGGSKLEVGDPLANTIYTVHGYQVEDMTFYSWFTRDAPSIGINGDYDMLGNLSGPAGVCP